MRWARKRCRRSPKSAAFRSSTATATRSRTGRRDVFELLKSRLDKAYSCFDGTFNPQYPSHWLKAFLDSDADLFSQTYTIDDNPFLPPEFVESLKREYAAAVY